MDVAVEFRRLDRSHGPTFTKCGLNLLLRNTSWAPPIRRLLFAESQHEVGAATRKDTGQALEEANAFRIREGVKQARVNRGFEGSSETIQFKGVPHKECCGDSPASGFCLGFLDGPGRGIDPPGLMALLCQIQRVLPRPAPDVQDRGSDSAFLFQRHKLGLGATDVPWRCSLIRRIKELQTRTSRGAGAGLPILRRPSFRFIPCPRR